MATTPTLERIRKIQAIMATAYSGMGAWYDQFPFIL